MYYKFCKKTEQNLKTITAMWFMLWVHILFLIALCFSCLLGQDYDSHYLAISHHPDDSQPWKFIFQFAFLSLLNYYEGRVKKTFFINLNDLIRWIWFLFKIVLFKVYLLRSIKLFKFPSENSFERGLLLI